MPYPNRTFRISSRFTIAAPAAVNVSGRQYQFTPSAGGYTGGYVDASNLDDAKALQICGYIFEGAVGTTAQRPLPTDADFQMLRGREGHVRFYDVTLSQWISWIEAPTVGVDGGPIGYWRADATGAQV